MNGACCSAVVDLHFPRLLCPGLLDLDMSRLPFFNGLRGGIIAAEAPCASKDSCICASADSFSCRLISLFLSLLDRVRRGVAREGASSFCVVFRTLLLRCCLLLIFKRCSTARLALMVLIK